MSRATNLVAEKLSQAKPTTVVPSRDIVPKADNVLVPSKDDRHCPDKSERSTDWKACLVRIPAVVGPVKVLLASSFCYGGKAERPNQTRRSGKSSFPVDFGVCCIAGTISKNGNCFTLDTMSTQSLIERLP